MSDLFFKFQAVFKLMFWSIIVAGFSFIMMSHPMMKPKYDIWHHLGYINDLVLNPNAVIPWRSNWYATWAYIFRVLGVQDIRIYAVIIHRTQFLLSCGVIYLSSWYLFTALIFKKEVAETPNCRAKDWAASFALSCTLVWLTVIGTVSTFQQAWIMWYSVNYQISLPFLYLAIALLIHTVATKNTWLAICIKLTCSLILLLLVLLFHAGELVYLSIYLTTALIVYTTKKNIIKVALILFLFLLLVWIGSHFYNERMPVIVTLVKSGETSKIIDLVEKYGQFNIQGGNRFAANWNALYAISVFCALPIYYIHYTNKGLINGRVLSIVLMSLVYCFIPTFKWSSGIMSLFYDASIVNRVYFASLLFILPSLLIYLILNKTNKFKQPNNLLLAVLLLMGLTALYSRYINNGGTYFENVNSIRNSIKPEKMNINLMPSDIDGIKLQIDAARIKYNDDEIIYCANYDKSHIIKYMYAQKNIIFERGEPHVIDDCVTSPKAKDKQIVYID
jgi:hypothetical protein